MLAKLQKSIAMAISNSKINGNCKNQLQNSILNYLEITGMSVAMPPANVSMMEDQERMEIRRWYDNAMSDAPMMIASH